MIRAETIRELSESRWFMPLLALLSRGKGARFAEMLNRVGLSRSMLRRTLDSAIARGWVRLNTGHGHPLRPEYLLTQSGLPLGLWCEAVTAERERLGLGPDRLGRWSLPLVHQLESGQWRRFTELRKELAPVTSRALSLALKQLLSEGLIERRLEDSFPPTPHYRLTGRGRALARTMRRDSP